MQYTNRNRHYSSYRRRDPRINYRANRGAANSPRLMRFGLMGCFLVLALAAVSIPNGSTSDQKPQVAAQAQKEPEVPPIDEQKLAADINAIIAKNQGHDIGVSITDLKTNTNYTYGVDKQFIAASVGKMLSAVTFLHEVEQGKRSLDDDLGGQTARAQIQKMVAASDNNAWVAINDTLGHSALAGYAQSNGLTNYDPIENKIKPSEVAKLLSDLYNGKLLDKDHTKFLLANMQQDQEEQQFIRRYIDADVTVFHKAGWLEDRAHDTAIIELADRPFILVIFTKSRHGVYDFTKGQKMFQEITNATVERFK